VLHYYGTISSARARGGCRSGRASPR